MLNYVAVVLDPVGNVSLSIQIVILFLLILGLPLVRRGESAKENLIVHGYLTLAAILLHTVLILIVMIPSFTTGLGEFTTLSFLASLTFWSHAVLGTTAEVLGIIIVVSWLSKPLSRMACVKTRAWMWPTFIIWTVSIINGALIHVLGLV
jgi:hypothetical protein